MNTSGGEKPWWSPPQGRTLNIAHRGGSSLGPENTLFTAARGHARGADAWELDVQMTRDGRLAVMHDPVPRRTTDITLRDPARADWPVHRFSLPELKELDFGSWFMEQDPFGQVASGWLDLDELRGAAGVKVSTLEDALLFSKERQWPVNVELKDHSGNPGHDRVVGLCLELIRRLDMGPLVLISSFNHDYLKQVRGLDPGMPLGVLVDEAPPDPVSLVRGLGAQTYHPSHRVLSPGHLAQLKEAGIPVLSYTVNQPQDQERLIRAGLAGLITDYPQRLAELLKRS